jgi:hypothetical protein
MSYFHSAMVFTSQPEWQALAELPPQIGFRGFRHSGTSLWMLDYWTGIRRQPPPSSPFTSGDETEVFTCFAGDATTDRLEQIAKCIDSVYGAEWLRLAMQVSRLVSLDLYFFAADDDLFDVGATIAKGNVRRVKLTAGLWLILAEDASFTLTPIRSDDGETDDSPASFSDLAYVTLKQPVEFPGGRRLYDNVVSEWPEIAGDPTELFGLGTWDPFVNAEQCLIKEYERLAVRAPRHHCTEAPKKKRAWWKFW